MELFEQLNKELCTSYKSNDDISWRCISIQHRLSEDFMRKYAFDLDWYYICMYQKMHEDFIKDFADKVNWDTVSAFQHLSEDFIREFQTKLNFSNISAYQKLSESFIREFSDKVDWHNVSKFQKLSEGFIREFSNKVDWHNISIYQKLSEDFICEFSDNIEWYYISQYQKLSDSFISEFKSKLDMEAVEDNWIYKSAEEKKKMLQETEKYECYDDYFVAYKAIRNDRYSIFNFQYEYEPNTAYESWCDCSDNENSFGLSVGTYDYAEKYLIYRQGKIVRCKVRYEDIGRIVHDGNKIRCFKITPIE